MKKVCIVGASGKLGQYMVQRALDLGYAVVGVCRERSVGKLDKFRGLITVFPGATNDRQVIKRAVEGCDGVRASSFSDTGLKLASAGYARRV